MKNRFRFQTKLMLTIVFAIALVTLAVLWATEAKIRQTYTDQFSIEFDGLVAQLERSREQKSAEFLESCKTLASHPFLAKYLKGETDKQSREDFIDSLPDIIDRPENRSQRIERPEADNRERRLDGIALMDLEGEFHFLATPSGRNDRGIPKRARGRLKSPEFRERIEAILKTDKQQTIYIPSPNRDNSVEEMVRTPVVDPETGEKLGFLLRKTAAETEAQKFLDRFQEEFQPTQRLLSGIYMNGEIYSRSIQGDFSTDLAEAVTNTFPNQTPIDGQKWTRFEVQAEDSAYQVYLFPLTDLDVMRPAYQLSAFSLAPLEEDLAELRIRGSGIAVVALLFGILLAALLSRNFAIPLKKLALGTQAIREGNLDHRVEINSKDEIGELADSFNQMADELKQKALYRELLGKVSDETVAQAMISGGLDLELGGETKEVSVLFCDIRGFTELTEQMHPSEVIDLLNEHMTAMTKVVREHYGVVDKFVGDEVMAVFGGLKSYGNDAELAASCALEMIRVREQLNHKTERPIEIGIGVATGEVVAGCMGSTDRLNYTVVGSRVNLASRLCGVAESMELVIDEPTLGALNKEPVVEEMTDLRLKGFSGKVTAYRLIELKSTEDIPTSVSISA
ncbi:MAG: hypothetical protein CMO55_14180 [Verrucomicrobiales bacterium]|nr:hypothetical protein [Verrucomicrobiales bacterium]